jgi:hypothetical protein
MLQVLGLHVFCYLQTGAFCLQTALQRGYHCLQSLFFEHLQQRYFYKKNQV